MGGGHYMVHGVIVGHFSGDFSGFTIVRQIWGLFIEFVLIPPPTDADEPNYPDTLNILTEGGIWQT